MPYGLDPQDVAMIRARLGPTLDALRSVMFDLDVPSMFLLSEDRSRVADAREGAIHLLDRWVVDAPDKAHEIFRRLPDLFWHESVASSLLEAVVASDSGEIPIEVFNLPSVDSPVFGAAPQLSRLLDESGLVRVEGLDARPWGLHTGDYAFHYHQLLRRDFRSGMHYGLVGTVLRAADEHRLVARLALDERRIRHASEYEELYEFDRWYGQQLNEEGLDSRTAVGETFHGDPDGGTSPLHPYAGLSVRWTVDSPLKTVEIEEFMPVPGAGAEWVFARYLHAIRDTESGIFVHCDGAVKAFRASEYPRVQSDFKNRGKGVHYRKLFRVDGEFPTSVWCDLALAWFRGNHLMAEYLVPAAG